MVPQMTRSEQKPPPPPDTPGEVRRKRKHDEDLLDDALENTFPASDPPAMTEPGSAEHAERNEPRTDKHKAEAE